MTDSNRELIAPRGNKRLVRRDSKGRFSQSDDLSRSLAQDVRQHAEHESKPGLADTGFDSADAEASRL
jgi:hypothetical protein